MPLEKTKFKIWNHCSLRTFTDNLLVEGTWLKCGLKGDKCALEAETRNLSERFSFGVDGLSNCFDQELKMLYIGPDKTDF